MESLKISLSKLETNPKDKYVEVMRLLIKIVDNILKQPENVRVRTLQKNNNTLSRKVLGVNGGLDCLKTMGFKEYEVSLVLPPNASLKWLEVVQNELLKHKNASTMSETNEFANLFDNSKDGEIAAPIESPSCSSDESDTSTEADTELPNQSKTDIIKQQFAITDDTPKVNLPPINYIFTNRFLRQVELGFHMALAYGDKDLQKRAVSLVPQIKLQLSAQKRLRILQEQVKKGKLEDPNISFDDLFLLELLAWFKNEFFIWVDSPGCMYCGESTYFSHMCNDSALMIHTQRVEMHKCKKCEKLTLFPRYNDVNFLLITRRGRCGEWANAFTLICCAMDFDARLVVDQGDHVWTEVYSYAQKRWLHCDPCENTCDTPLTYENGWGKILSYVMAYSAEEVQDVTWRYSSQHKAILIRRNECTENELIDAILKLRAQRQHLLSPARKEFLTKRLLSELVEFMTEKKPSNSDKQGRISGSQAWRLARGEIQTDSESCYNWVLKKCDVDSGNITIRYSAASDKYEYITHGGEVTELSSWHAFTFNSSDLFRKEEKDWKMAYIARKEGADVGKISWKFVMEDSEKAINSIDVKFDHQIYENGKVEIQIVGENASVDFPTNISQMKTTVLSGSKSVLISARLSGGKSDVAWQHAQLFRQSLTSKDFPFSVTFNFI